jgi:hypothetical protein
MLPNKMTPSYVLADSWALKSPLGTTLAAAFPIGDRLEPADFADPVRERRARRLLVEQLLLILRGYYVHLETKRARYGFDPVRALELLLADIDSMTASEFHQSIVQVVNRVRDRHFQLIPAAPYGQFARANASC